MSFTVGVVCDIGAGPARGGRERNEDNFLVCSDGRVWYHEGGVQIRLDQAGDGLLVAVCDGMGGHADGHVASTTAAKVIAKLYQPGSPRRPAKVLLKYILESHRQLHWAARNDGTVGMGTTLTAVWVLNGQAAWSHVGDSRLYLHRGGRLVQVTADQTRNEFARRDGRPTTPDGDHLAQTFIYGSRGLGDNAALRLEQGLDSGAEVLEEGDRLLLCSDGLTSAVDDDRIARVLDQLPDPQAACERLRTLALERGSRDNVTVLIVRVDAAEGLVDEWTDDGDDTVRF
ncbi:MAG: protein phosphatase 2C domain-containing protein [Myxococcota bacterium]